MSTHSPGGQHGHAQDGDDVAVPNAGEDRGLGCHLSDGLGRDVHSVDQLDRYCIQDIGRCRNIILLVVLCKSAIYSNM